VRSKLRIDPVCRALFDLGTREPFGSVVDIACGRGQLGLLFLEGNLADQVLGFDWDEAKVGLATSAAGDPSRARFETGDVRSVVIPRADTVLLVDILHYLTVSEQDDLLARASQAARRRVVVRDIDPSRGAASVFTRTWEWITTTAGYNRGARVSPRPFDEIATVLERHGMSVTREACSAKGLSNALLIGHR
jgi:hypothetical protein